MQQERLLAQRGAAVYVNYAVHADAAEALIAEITAVGGRAIAVAADVAEAGRVVTKSLDFVRHRNVWQLGYSSTFP